MGIAIGGKAIESGDNLAIGGIQLSGIAIRGKVVFASEVELPPVTGPLPLITSVVLGALDTSHTGLLGMRMVVGSTPLIVSAIGRWLLPQNSGQSTLYLTTASYSPLWSAIVDATGAPRNQFVYAPVSPLANLSAGGEYFLWLSAGGGDQFFDSSPVVTTNAANVMAAVGTAAGQANQVFGPVNLLYEI